MSIQRKSGHGRSRNVAGKECKNCGRIKRLHRPTGLGGSLCPVQFKKRDVSRPMSEFLYAEPYAGRYTEEKRVAAQ